MGGELWRFDDTQLMAETLAVSAEIHTAQVHRMDLMIAMYERDTVTEHGYRSPAHWLCAATHLEIGECHRIESLARLLRVEPEVRKRIHPACSRRRKPARSRTSASTTPAP